MADAAPPEAQGFLQRRLGLPSMAGNGKMVNAAVIDSIGSGLVLAFILVYFSRTTDLSLPAIGGALTLARFLAVPTAVVVGPIIDRFGARTVALAGNLISAVGYAGFLFSTEVWQIVLVSWLAQIGAAAYWTSSTGLVVLASPAERRPRWFAMLHMLRNSGMGIGGALGAFLIGFEGTAGLKTVVVANAVSYVTAAALLALWKPTHAPEPDKTKAADDGKKKGSYLTVLRDKRYMLLVAINVNFVFAALILSLLLAVFVTEGLDQPAWIGGVLLVMNTVQVAVTQTLVNRRMERFRPIRVIAASCGINALAFAIFAVLDFTPVWFIFIGLFLGMLLYNLAETTATPFSEDLSVSLAPEGLRGRYLAVYQLSWTFGQTVGPGLLTLLLSQGAAWPWVFLVVISVVTVPALLLLERMVDAGKPSSPEPSADTLEPEPA